MGQSRPTVRTTDQSKARLYRGSVSPARVTQPISDQGCSSTNQQGLHPPTTKHRTGKGGRIIDTVMELMSNRAFWKEVSCPADYHYLGVFSKERMQCMLFIPNISNLKSHAEMSDDFV